MFCSSFQHTSSCIARSKCDGTCAETRFGISVKRTSPFKSAGASVQSTAGSRGVRISGQQLYRPCSDIQCKTTGYPLHSHLSPSLPLLCVTVCHQVLNALYNHFIHMNVNSSDSIYCGWLQMCHSKGCQHKLSCRCAVARDASTCSLASQHHSAADVL